MDDFLKNSRAWKMIVNNDTCANYIIKAYNSQCSPSYAAIHFNLMYLRILQFFFDNNNFKNSMDNSGMTYSNNIVLM